MNFKNILFVCCFAGLSSMIFGQEYAIDKKATMLSLMGSYTSSGGKLFEDASNNNVQTFTLTPSFNHFVSKNFFIGGGLETSNQTQGGSSVKSFGFGPLIGYAFGKSNSTAFPYIDLGLRYYSITSDGGYGYNTSVSAAGTDLFFDFGVIFPIKDHVGLTFEGGDQSLKLKMSDYTNVTKTGNIFSFSMGFVGLLF
jgi:hypothetical protein